MKTKIICLLTLWVITCLGLFAYAGYNKLATQQRLLESRKESWMNLKNALENRIAHFRGDVSVVIKDLDTNLEIDFNKDMLLPSASLVKIPIMLSCFYAAEDGKIRLDDRISLKPSEKVSGSRVLGHEPAGQAFTVEELLGPMITQSDNAAANVLIDFLGFDNLNSYFKRMGLKSTNLARRMMDFEERSQGQENYTTAQDMAFMLEGLYRRHFLSKDISERCLSLLGQQRINDRIPRKLPKGGVLIAHKTGLERHICHDVGIVFTNKGNFLICILVKHENRFAEPAKRLISDLALATFDYYRNL